MYLVAELSNNIFLQNTPGMFARHNFLDPRIPDQDQRRKFLGKYMTIIGFKHPSPHKQSKTFHRKDRLHDILEGGGTVPADPDKTEII